MPCGISITMGGQSFGIAYVNFNFTFESEFKDGCILRTGEYYMQDFMAYTMHLEFNYVSVFVFMH